MDNNSLGYPSRKHPDARDSPFAGSRTHRRQTQKGLRTSRSRRLPRSLIFGIAVAFCTHAALADTSLRIATYTTELHRDGPGILLRDVLKGNDAQVEAVAQVIAAAEPDVIVLQGIDYDYHNETLRALRDSIDAYGWHMAHLFSLAPNAGLATGLDMDGDGRTGYARDAQGYGEFWGQGGMAVLSRYSILDREARDYSSLLWRDLPNALLPVTDAGPFPSKDAQENQRLSSVGHWVIPIKVNNQRLDVMTFHAGPPVFDGPEDRNGRRNHDEITFWLQLLDGQLGASPSERFVLAGNANLDPIDGEGRKSAIKALLDDRRLQDPLPMRSGDPSDENGHQGDPRLDTVAWPGPEPGHLRVSYVLPSVDLSVIGSGILWPDSGSMVETVNRASRHRLVWVDLRF